MAVLAIILHIPGACKANTPWREQVNPLDPSGTVFFISGIVYLLPALQWGGTTYAWKAARFRSADIRLHSHPSLEERNSYSPTSHNQKPHHSRWHMVTRGIFDDGHGLLRSDLVSSN